MKRTFKERPRHTAAHGNTPTSWTRFRKVFTVRRGTSFLANTGHLPLMELGDTSVRQRLCRPRNVNEIPPLRRTVFAYRRSLSTRDFATQGLSRWASFGRRGWLEDAAFHITSHCGPPVGRGTWDLVLCTIEAESTRGLYKAMEWMYENVQYS